MLQDAPTRPEWLAAVGAVAAAVGTLPPWIVVAPGQEMVIQVYVTGMAWGIGGMDYPVLGALAVGIAAAAATRRQPRGGSLAAATGLAIGGLALYYLGATLLDGPTSLGTFLPGPGAGLTLAGAALLVVAGAWHRRATAGRGDDRAVAGSPG